MILNSDRAAAGHFAILKLLASGVRGNQTEQTFVINYTDGAAQTIMQSISDWHTPQHYVGEAIASSMAYRVGANGSHEPGPYNLYGYSLGLDFSKNVKSITLPPSEDVVTFAMTLVP